MSLRERIRRFRERGRPDGSALPDPSKPPTRRGDWDNAALTNVEITEQVKREIRAVTRPWDK